MDSKLLLLLMSLSDWWEKSPSLSPPFTSPPKAILEHTLQRTSPIPFFWQSDSLASGCSFFGPAGRAFKSRRPFWKQDWICVAMTPKGKAEIICVDGSGVPLFIGHVTPWGRTNWWPQRAPCFVPAAHKGIGVRSARGWGWRGAAVGTSRFPID